MPHHRFRQTGRIQFGEGDAPAEGGRLEACHGPGSAHVESSDPKDIKNNVSEKDCTVCHNPDRVEAFRFKPLIYGGAH